MRRALESMLTSGLEPSPRFLCCLLEEQDCLAPVFRKAIQHLGHQQVIKDILSSLDTFEAGTDLRQDTQAPRSLVGILLKGWKLNPASRKAIFAKKSAK